MPDQEKITEANRWQPHLDRIESIYKRNQSDLGYGMAGLYGMFSDLRSPRMHRKLAAGCLLKAHSNKIALRQIGKNPAGGTMDWLRKAAYHRLEAFRMEGT